MRREQSMFTGAAILAGAGLVVKVIGACFKIPLGAFLQPEGIAVFSVAYNLYALLFTIATAGVPIAVSKLVAEAAAQGRHSDAVRVLKAALLGFAFVGLFGTAVLFFCAAPLAKAMGVSGAMYAIRTISPAILFVSVLSVCRGYYQGFCDMFPTATSEVIEALVKLILGLFFAWWLGQKGYPVAIQAAGAIGGVTAGAAIACLYICMARRKVGVQFPRSSEMKTGYRSLLKQLFSQTIPITLGAAAIGLTNVIDSGLIMKLLQNSGVSAEASMWLYGTYTYAANLFNLPNVLVSTLAVSLIPAVAGAAAQPRQAETDVAANHALSIAALLASAAACGLFALSQPILDLLYGRGVEADAIRQAGSLLSVLCFGIPPLALTTMTNALHQAAGRVKLPVVSVLVGAAVKLIANYFLIQIPKIHILGAAISTVLCYTVIAAINWAFLKRAARGILPLGRLWGKPLLVGICTGCAAKLMFWCSMHVFSSEIAVALSILCGGIVFLLVGSLAKTSLLSVINTKKMRKK